jgi:hypothetical protein
MPGEALRDDEVEGGIPAAAHAFTIFTRSAALFGSATPNGTSS